MSVTLRRGDPADAGMDLARLERVARLLAEWVESGHTQAIVALVVRGGAIVLQEAFGRLTPESDSPPARLDTIFPVASLSKPFTAATVMSLVEDGLVGLNRPVQEYLPEFVGVGKEAVMVHHLLTHTAGLEDEAVVAHVTRLRPAGEPPPAVRLFSPYVMFHHFADALGAPLATAPGTRMYYSNFGYSLLGEIAVRVGGRPFAELLHERILRPLGLDDTYVEVPESRWHRVVRRPAGAPAAHLNLRERLEHAVPQGGLSTTALDLARLGQAFLDRGAGALSPASVAAMTRNQIPGMPGHWRGEFFPEGSWGLGWNLPASKRAPDTGSLSSPATFTHGGSGGSYLWIDPASGLVGVYLSVWMGMRNALVPDFRPDLFENAVTAAVVG